MPLKWLIYRMLCSGSEVDDRSRPLPRLPGGVFEACGYGTGGGTSGFGRWCPLDQFRPRSGGDGRCMCCARSMRPRGSTVGRPPAFRASFCLWWWRRRRGQGAGMVGDLVWLARRSYNSRGGRLLDTYTDNIEYPDLSFLRGFFISFARVALLLPPCFAVPHGGKISVVVGVVRARETRSTESCTSHALAAACFLLHRKVAVGCCTIDDGREGMYE